MPKVYQIATKVADDSGQAREYPAAPMAPANSPEANPALLGCVGARPFTAHKIPANDGNEKPIKSHGHISHVCPTTADHRSS